MTKYPIWKYLIIIIAVLVGIIYTLPTFYGELPAIQVSNIASGSPISQNTINAIKGDLASSHIPLSGVLSAGKTLKFTFKDVDTQLKAKDIIQSQLGPQYTVALNLVSASPPWLKKINANPMFLGLDLRGGVHFLFAVDMNAALKKTLDKDTNEIKQILRGSEIRYGSIVNNGKTLTIHMRDAKTTEQALKAIKQALTNIAVNNSNNNVVVTIPAQEIKLIEEAAVKQNILIMHNRVNELGVSEPIIQQQGPERIVVELPGIQDTARAKSILGRTATLEVRLVDDDPTDLSQAQSGNTPADYELLNDAMANGVINKILVKKDVELTGDNINDAEPGFDENGNPAVNIRLDSTGAAIFKQLTQDNLGKRMAMVLVENGKSQVVTAPVIRSVIGGGQVQISGAMNVQQANDTALLLRSGALAAPMQIIEESTVGPSLGHDNIVKGFHAVLGGFIAIGIFMIIYYQIFGVVAVASLSINLLLLIAVLSMLQATLTLPGIAAIALTLGMAIDSNVLINERIREELRNGQKFHAAIQMGYEHAWATILDSNVTTLIAGLALLAFGTGPVKGFAIVHCLGILTSMFSAVLVSRGIVGFMYAGRRIRKLYI